MTMKDVSDAVVSAGRRLGPSLLKRLQQNIIDEMPTGSHRARAEAWRKLARRCDAAADAHQATADQREATRRIVNSFAPAYRQAALSGLQRGVPITFELPPGFSDVRDAEPDMSPEDFQAFVDEEARLADLARSDAAKLELAAKQQAKQDGYAGVCIWWRRVPGVIPGVCPYSPTCKGHGGYEPADGLGGHFDCVGPAGEPGATGVPWLSEPEEGAPSDGVWRTLTRAELDESQVWTGRFYRDLTLQEKRDGRTAEPTMKLEPGTEGP
jgi:hypothetical protein